MFDMRREGGWWPSSLRFEVCVNCLRRLRHLLYRQRRRLKIA